MDQLTGDLDMLAKRFVQMEKHPGDFKLTDQEIVKRRNRLNDLRVSLDRIKKQSGGDNAAKRYAANDDKGKKSAPMEIDRTLNFEMDGNAALQQQQFAMQQQDTHLDELLYGVGRLKQIGTDIGQELDLQSSLLDDLDKGVDKTTGKIKSNTKRAGALIEESDNGLCGSGWCGFCTILILIGVIIMLVATNYACYVFNSNKC